jgi:hypothetical protein
MLSLISGKDQTKVEIFRSSARLSGLLKNILEEYSEEKELSIPEIDGEYLKHIADFLNHYKDSNPKEVQKPLEKYDIASLYGEWEDNFISQFSKDKKYMWGLMEAANFLDCKALLELSASKIACSIQKLSGEEMLEYFELDEDMTDEDVRKMEEDFEKEMEEKRKEEFNALISK